LVDITSLLAATAVFVARFYAFAGADQEAYVCESNTGHRCSSTAAPEAGLMQLSITVDQNSLSLPLALKSVAVLLLWARLLLLFPRFSILGPLLQIVGSMMFHDLWNFLLLYTPFLCGFAAALSTIYASYEPGEGEIGNLFGNYWRTLRTLVWAGLFGVVEGPFEAILATPEAVISSVFFSVYLVVASVLLVNMLIAVSDNYLPCNKKQYTLIEID
jgi:hypothetical protein